ncbi:hypothetical protein O0L34_g4144 [Tuta absoluta]|nr:hypothetical protein O0L34_g4144 [Tuta absoluta]
MVTFRFGSGYRVTVSVVELTGDGKRFRITERYWYLKPDCWYVGTLKYWVVLADVPALLVPGGGSAASLTVVPGEQNLGRCFREILKLRTSGRRKPLSYNVEAHISRKLRK